MDLINSYRLYDDSESIYVCGGDNFKPPVDNRYTMVYINKLRNTPRGNPLEMEALCTGQDHSCWSRVGKNWHPRQDFNPD